MQDQDLLTIFPPFVASIQNQCSSLKDHCRGKYLNELAAKAGCKLLPYRKLQPIGADTGEVFLYEYYV